MSMSTNIDDLPGPEEQIELPSQPHPQPHNIQPSIQIREKHSNVSSNIKKKSSMGCINEENALVFILLFFSTMRTSDEYTRKLLSSLPLNIGYNFISLGLLKSILLLLAFLIIKYYILPNVDLFY
jgi:hypothetical protein